MYTPQAQQLSSLALEAFGINNLNLILLSHIFTYSPFYFEKYHFFLKIGLWLSNLILLLEIIHLVIMLTLSDRSIFFFQCQMYK